MTLDEFIKDYGDYPDNILSEWYKKQHREPITPHPLVIEVKDLEILRSRLEFAELMLSKNQFKISALNMDANNNFIDLINRIRNEKHT